MVTFQCDDTTVAIINNEDVFYTRRGWLRAEELQQGDRVHLSTLDAGASAVTSKPVVSKGDRAWQA